LRASALHLDDRTLTDVILLVSEAVTNAVRHAGLHEGDPIDVSVAVTDELVHVRIAQGGEPPPEPEHIEAPPTPGVAGGWGLVIIDRIAERWGVEPHPATVWFDVRRVTGD
jgi:anti-sigma regulatory factor (Ser/Thr protein kinase)